MLNLKQTTCWMAGAVVLMAGLASCGPEENGVATLRQGLGTPTWPIHGVSPSICAHIPGSIAHRPSGGIGSADDSYALDLNCIPDVDSGKPVNPVRPGTVRAAYAGSEGSTSYVLVEHPESMTVDGVYYPSFYTAYLHMSGITITPGTWVDSASTLGRVSHYGMGSGGADHLHFVAYVGNWSSGAAWGRLRSFDPAALGGDFALYSYAPYVYRAWVDNSASTGSFAFVASGSSSDLFTNTSYGMFGSMMYTTTRASSPDDNSFEFKWNAGVPGTHGYYVFPFIPSNYATTTKATYRLLAGTSTATSAQSAVDSFSMSQAALSDRYYMHRKSTISAGSYVTLKVGDATGEASAKLGADYAVLFWKADHCLGSGCSIASTKDYCYQTNYELTSLATSCIKAATLPSGF